MNFQIEEKFIPDKTLHSYKKALEFLQQESPTEAGVFLIDMIDSYVRSGLPMSTLDGLTKEVRAHKELRIPWFYRHNAFIDEVKLAVESLIAKNIFKRERPIHITKVQARQLLLLVEYMLYNRYVLPGRQKEAAINNPRHSHQINHE